MFYLSSCQLPVATVATAQHLTRSERVNQSLFFFCYCFVTLCTFILGHPVACTCIVQATLTSSPTVHSTEGSSEGNALPRSPGRRCCCFTFPWSWWWSSLWTTYWKDHPALHEGWTCTLLRIHLSLHNWSIGSFSIFAHRYPALMFKCKRSQWCCLQQGFHRPFHNCQRPENCLELARGFL